MYGLAAYTAWGMFPLFWKLVSSVPAEQILAHRIIWSLVFVFALMLFQRDKTYISYLKNFKILGLLTVTGLLIGGNWYIYIYAVNTNRILDTSLGYYISPIANVFLGIVFLKERLTKIQYVAVGFALAGIIWLAIQHGSLPWISLSLPLSFSLYGFLRKKANLEAFPSLLVETIILTPIALLFLIYAESRHVGVFLHQGWFIDVMLILGGVITAIPLLWFGLAAVRIPLSTIGFLQYISPTLQLITGVFVFGESFGHERFVSFILVWIGLGIYTYSLIHKLRLSAKAVPASPERGGRN